MLIKTIKPDRWIVKAPPSKSYTNRALLIAGLANGKSILINPSFCEDSLYMIKALKKLGLTLKIQNDSIIIFGCKGKFPKTPKKIFVGNAGTTFRFLVSALALSDGTSALDGDDRMRERPIKDLINALKQLGVEIQSADGYPPLTIHGGSMQGGKIIIRGNKSSQYLSSILISAPYAKNEIDIFLNNKLTSKPYIDITLEIMDHFGIKVGNENYKKFHIKSGQLYSGKKYIVEGDASNASYFLAAAAITGGHVKVTNLFSGSKQGDLKFVDVLEKMGCLIKRGKNYVNLSGKELCGIDIDMNDMPDIVPTLAVVACFAKGKTTIRNVSNLRIKESDRIQSLCAEISKIGAKTVERKDGLVIIPQDLHGASIETYNDHRIAMSFSIVGLRIPGIVINNPGCVKKSFPGYWKIFKNTFYKN